MLPEAQEEVLATLFGDAVDWDANDPTTGYITCPGADKHTHSTGRRDTRLYINGVPNVFCLHQKCAEEVETLTENVRGALKASGYEQPPMSKEVRDRTAAKHGNAKDAHNLSVGVRIDDVFGLHAWPAEQIAADNPDGPLGQFNHRELFLQQMFRLHDTVWIGQPYQSGPAFASQFQTVDAWLSSPPASESEFICPNTFPPGTHQRGTKQLAVKRYFVIEGDDCHADKDTNRDCCGAIFKYAMARKPQLKLRAVVDAGNKSLHGWFEYPGDDIYRWCREVLPAMGADPATMRLAQPVRLAGQTRASSGKEQRLLWISK